MQPHDLLYDGEAEARAKRGSPSATPESIEDPLAVLRGNAGSLILCVPKTLFELMP